MVSARRGWAGPQTFRCTICNSPPINGQCTVPITVLLYNCPSLCGFNVPYNCHGVYNRWSCQGVYGIIIIIIKNECHSNIIVNRLQGFRYDRCQPVTGARCQRSCVRRATSSLPAGAESFASTRTCRATTTTTTVRDTAPAARSSGKWRTTRISCAWRCCDLRPS